MSKEKSLLLKRLNKTLAVTVPALALSGFLPVASLVTVSTAQAEHHAEAGYKHKGAEAKSKYHSEAKSKYHSEAKAKSEAEAKAEAKPEAKAEAEGEAKY